MAKQASMGDLFFIGGYNISGDTNSLSRIGGGNSPIVVTDITQSAESRLGGKRSGGMDFNVYLNDASGRAHAALSTLPTTDVIAMWFRGQAIGNAGAACVAKQVGYDPTRNEDGSILFGVSAQSNGYGLEFGEQLTAGLRTDSTATNGASYDGGAATNFGAQFYLEMISVTGTSCTVTIEDSADNASFAAVTGGAFTAVAAGSRANERIATSDVLTVRRYLRAVTSGTFSDAQFAVLAVRNQTATTF